MAYIITGTLTFSSQANRDAARTRINTALASHAFSTRTTVFPGGVNNSGTTIITISLDAGGDSSAALALSKDIYDAAVQSNRPSAGYLSVNKI